VKFLKYEAANVQHHDFMILSISSSKVSNKFLMRGRAKGEENEEDEERERERRMRERDRTKSKG
jgi:hypothetical protein